MQLPEWLFDAIEQDAALVWSRCGLAAQNAAQTRTVTPS